MRVVFLGDVVGSPGRRALRQFLPAVIEAYEPDFVVANAENAAGGYGLTKSVAEELFDLGIDVLTSGNHIWKREFLQYLSESRRVLRPANYPEEAPGRGFTVVEKGGKVLGVLNLEGRIFMRPLLCPLRTADAVIRELPEGVRCVLVDFHAEATSEKILLGWWLDGKVSAVLGTHTHVQTADERILPKGTAYITDVGMCGLVDGVIGMKREQALEAYLSQVPRKLEVPKSGAVKLEGVFLELDPSTGRALKIERIRRQEC